MIRAVATLLISPLVLSACLIRELPGEAPPQRVSGVTVLLEGAAEVHDMYKCARYLSGWGQELRDGVVAALRQRGFKVISSPDQPHHTVALLTAVANGCTDTASGTGLVMLKLLHRSRPVATSEVTFKTRDVKGQEEGVRVIDSYTRALTEELVCSLQDDFPRLEALAAASVSERAAGWPSPRAASRPVVALFDVEQTSSTAAAAPISGEELSVYLTARLAESGAFRLIPRPDLRRALRRQKLESYSDCYDSTCQIELGRALAADKILTTRVLELDAQCLTSAILYDLASETTDRAHSVKGPCSRGGLMRSVEQIAQALQGGLVSIQAAGRVGVEH